MRLSHSLRWARYVANIGVFIFLALHIFNIWLVGLGPEAFSALAITYEQPLSRILHVFLFFCVVFYAVDGMRTLILDFQPSLWRYEKQSIYVAAAVFFLLTVPSAILILMDTVLPY